MSSVKETHRLCCPSCGRDDDLRVLARFPIELLPNGGFAHCDQNCVEIQPNDPVLCNACEHDGLAKDFEVNHDQFNEV